MNLMMRATPQDGITISGEQRNEKETVYNDGLRGRTLRLYQGADI